MNYSAIIFDCDGILVDSEGLSNNILVEMCNELGISINLNYALTHFQGRAIAHVFKKLEALYQAPLPMNFEEEFRKRTFKAFKEEIKPMPGVLEIVRDLKCPIAVASNGPRNKMELTLKTTLLYPYFKDRIFSAYDIQKWKPDPSLFLYAVQQIGCEPREALVVEDSLAGVNAALNGGFSVVALMNKHNQEAMSASGARTITRLLDLKNLL